MHAFAAISLLIFASAITPGPNNLIVLRRASAAGFGAALPAMAGVLAGGVAMLVLAELGLAALVVARPGLLDFVVLAGCGYLVYLGLTLMRGAAPGEGGAAPPDGVLAVFAFQFANPKAWVLALTAVGAAHEATSTGLDVLALLATFAAISFASLCAWALLGRALLRWRAASMLWLDRAMACALIGSAASLIVTRWTP